MKKHYFWAFMLLAPAAFVGCSDIDLNDVDTNVSLPVNDFEIPIKLDKLELGTMLDVDNDGKLRNINGGYAVVVEGGFESDPVHVPAFTAEAEKIGESHSSMTKSKPGANSAKRSKRAVDFNNPKAVAEYVLPELKNIVKANATKIDEAIQKLKSVKAQTTFSFELNLDEKGEVMQKVKAIHVENFQVQVPRGIIGTISIVNGDGKEVIADYDSSTGLVSFAGKNIYTTDGKLKIKGEVTGFDANLLEEAFHGVLSSSNGRGKRAAGENSLNIDEQFCIVKGSKAVVYDTDFKNTNLSEEEMFNSLPNQAECKSSGEMDDVKVTGVSGRFKVKDFTLDPVSLNDIPEVLRQSGTSLHIDNPQIYVNLHNPVASGEGKPLTVTTELGVEAKSKSGKTHKYELDEKIEARTSDYFFYLSPKEVAPEEKYEGFENANHITFTALSDILSCIDEDFSTPSIDVAAGEGLPETLSISATNTEIISEDVDDLTLDQDYFLKGEYAFLAPLALGENSRIKYTDVVDGWHGDIDGVVITKLVLNANVTTDVPFELQFRITPIDERGERIEGKYTTLIVPANAKNAPIELIIEGDIHDLDGVKFEALAVSKEARTLSPNMNISISGLKVKVSGKYEAEL